MDSYTIYPKQFRNAKIPIEKNRCFFLMPFSEEFDGIYGHIKKSLHSSGYVCNRADEILGSKPIMNKILNEILRSHYIIADLTNQNPNVFYELGIAHTFKDAQNIILITQKVTDIPFDIRHINNIVYESNNIKYLTSSIILTLQENKYLLSFHEALQQKNIIDFIHDNKDDFVSYIQNRLEGLIPLATDILNQGAPNSTETEIESYFSRLIHILGDSAKEGNHNFLNGVMRVLTESVIRCNQHNVTDRIAYDMLFGDLLAKLSLNSIDIVSHQTDFAISLASQRAKLNSSMSWIINYFSNSKSATIDLNRYKVERFLMFTDDKLINTMIIDSLFHENCYIREHLSDIIGEKKLYEGGDMLVSQLLVEDNYFTAISIIAAIGKIGINKGPEAIMTWLDDKSDDIISTNQLFVLKHINNALTRLDKRNNTSYTDKFNLRYKDYLKNYFIL
jgi:hypothetical protein